MKDTLKPGVEHTFHYVVPEERTVPHLLPESEIFAGMPRVLATGYFVGLVEWACMEAMAPFLEEGEGSVGIRIDVTHTAPTLPGVEIRIRVTCVEVDGRRTRWEVEARDEKEPIGSGFHERFTVQWERFRSSLEKKAGS